MAGLPSFFHHRGTTVLHELSNFELGDDGLDEPLEAGDDDLDRLIGENPNAETEDGNNDADLATFGGESFGDLKASSLPGFFAAPKIEDLNLNSLPAGLAPTYPTSTPSKMAPPPGMEHMSPHSTVKHLPAPGLAPRTPSSIPPPGLSSATKSTPYRPMTLASPAAPSVPPVFSTPLKNLQEFASNLPTTPIAPTLTIPVAPTLSTPRSMIASIPIAPGVTPGPVAPPPTPATPATSTIPPQKEFYGRGQFMSASDVRYVATKALQPLETNDVYGDDFYFLQFNLKKNQAAREEAARTAKAMPAPMALPLPTWKETKERIKQQLVTSRQFCEGKTREWEQQEQVLGHRNRSDVTKPKALLALPSVQDMDFDAFDNDDDTEWKSPFSTRLWTTRQAVQKGYEALFTVQELQSLASSPLVFANPAAMEEIRREMETAVGLLSESLGILNRSSDWAGVQDQVPSLDGRHVAAIMQTAMGRKLLCRSLKLLNPNQRWALVPVVLARALMAPSQSAPQASVTAAAAQEALAVERKLLRTIADFIQFCYQTHLQGASMSAATDSSARELLQNLRQCVKNVIVTHMEKDSQLRETLQAEKSRAEVMHLVIQVGENISLETNSELAEEWTQTKDAFMAMLER